MESPRDIDLLILAFVIENTIHNPVIQQFTVIKLLIGLSMDDNRMKINRLKMLFLLSTCC